MIEKVLIADPTLYSAMGMRTLDPSDWNYNGDYGHRPDDTDRKTAGGFNYHQGPEWVWPIGYFLRAQIIFSETTTKPDLAHEVYKHLLPHIKHLRESPFRGLPELTNTNGSKCEASCDTQAWSLATVLDAVYDVHQATGN